MKVDRNHTRRWMLFGGTVAVILFSGQLALAAEAVPSWRPAYDTAMRWVNFLLLVLVIVKYGREPLKHFLNMRKEEIQVEILLLEDEKKRLLGQVKEARQQREDQERRLVRLKERIIADGEKRKRAIVEDARRQSLSMIEDAKRKIDHRIAGAKTRLKSELVDMAIDSAMRSIPDHVTDVDNEKLLEAFLDTVRP